MSNIKKLSINGISYNIDLLNKTILWCTDENGEPDSNGHHVKAEYLTKDNMFILRDSATSVEKLPVKIQLSDQLVVRDGKNYSRDLVLTPWFDTEYNHVVCEGWNKFGNEEEGKVYPVRTGYADEAASLLCEDGSGKSYPLSYWAIRSRFKNDPVDFTMYAKEYTGTNIYPVSSADLQCYFNENKYDYSYSVIMRAVYNIYGDGLFGLKCYGSSGQNWGVSVDSAKRVIAPSSLNVKTNIKDIDTDILHRLMDIRVISFNYTEDAKVSKKIQEKTSFGCIAEDVYELIPELVEIDDDGHPCAISYSDMIPLLLSVIQNQNKKIVDLEDRILTLEQKI